MENPFAKLVREDEPQAEDDKTKQLEDAQNRLRELEMYESDWTAEDGQRVEDLENQIKQLKEELGQ